MIFVEAKKKIKRVKNNAYLHFYGMVCLHEKEMTGMM